MQKKIPLTPPATGYDALRADIRTKLREWGQHLDGLMIVAIPPGKERGVFCAHGHTVAIASGLAVESCHNPMLRKMLTRHFPKIFQLLQKAAEHTESSIPPQENTIPS